MSLRGKLVLIGIGVGVGYILGARAGRERYDQIVRTAKTVWHAPVVQGTVGKAGEFLEDRLSDVGDLLKAGASNVIDRATGARKSRRTVVVRGQGSAVVPVDRSAAAPTSPPSESM